VTGEAIQLGQVLDEADDRLREAVNDVHIEPAAREVGHIAQISTAVATVNGLSEVASEEVVRFPDGKLGMAYDLRPEQLGVVLLDSPQGLESGDAVYRTGRVVDVPVGDALIGRVVDALGRPRDGRGAIRTSDRLAVEQDAPAILDRDPVDTPLQTGVKVIDALIPVGRGQRELILGDRQTGKTAIALDAILNQKGFDVVCIYCAIGRRSSAVASVIDTLRTHQAIDYSIVVVASGEDPAGLRWLAPYAATAMGEHFMRAGRDVLVVYDDLTQHARSYRELSLLLRRPPGREAYPGDIFYIHSRLLERATHLREDLGGGSLTALPIVETQAQNLSAYIPTNLISITDGQIYLSPDLYQQGQLPAVDVGRSVSRVGGKAQLPAFREASGDLRLAYSQFQELERFSRYGTRLEEKQRRQLEHGRRVRRVLRQSQYHPMPAAEQVAVLLAAKENLLDDIPVEQVGQAEQDIRQAARDQAGQVLDKIAAGEKLDDDDIETLLQAGRDALDRRKKEAERQSEQQQQQEDLGDQADGAEQAHADD
jgi:F-type H+-transporting ATPase subunit alpha